MGLATRRPHLFSREISAASGGGFAPFGLRITGAALHRTWTQSIHDTTRHREELTHTYDPAQNNRTHRSNMLAISYKWKPLQHSGLDVDDSGILRRGSSACCGDLRPSSTRTSSSMRHCDHVWESSQCTVRANLVFVADLLTPYNPGLRSAGKKRSSRAHRRARLG